MKKVEANRLGAEPQKLTSEQTRKTASMSNRPIITMKTTISNDTALIKLIRIMPFVLSAVCAGAAFAKLIG